MTLFSVTNLDKDGALSIRLDNRAAHVDYLKALGDALHLAGPLLSDDGETMIGSQLIVEFTDLAAAHAWASEDPYAKAGLFASSTVRPFKKVLPAA
jgi:uncharacterized protein YciI